MIRPGWILLLAVLAATGALRADDTPAEGGERPKPKPTAAELQIPDPGTERVDSFVIQILPSDRDTPTESASFGSEAIGSTRIASSSEYSLVPG